LGQQIEAARQLRVSKGQEIGFVELPKLSIALIFTPLDPRRSAAAEVFAVLPNLEVRQ
jgi:hypothetical protein